MLAMNSRAPRGIRLLASSLTTFPGKPAPTVDGVPPAGASLLAKNVQAPQGVRQPASSLTTIVDKSAPRGARVAALRGFSI